MSQIRSHLKYYILIYLVWIAGLWALTGGLENPLAWPYSWNKWDALWYQKIWEHGYLLSDPMTFAFPPAYSYLIGGLAKLFGTHFHITALAVNCLAFFGFAMLAAEVLASQFKVSRLAMFAFALTSPTSYFVFTTYSDSVFALLMWGAIFTALLYPHSFKARIVEVLLLFAMPWFRLTGYAMASWLLVRRWSVLVVFVSLAGWMALNWLISGDALHFLEVQKLFSMEKGGFLEGLAYSWRDFHQFPAPFSEGFDSWLQFHFLPLVYLVLFFVTGLWLLWRKQWLLALTLGSVFFMSHNQSFWRSVIRYNSPLIPLLGVALWSWGARLKYKNAFAWGFVVVIGIVQLCLQVHFAKLFRAGFWGF